MASYKWASVTDLWKSLFKNFGINLENDQVESLMTALNDQATKNDATAAAGTPQPTSPLDKGLSYAGQVSNPIYTGTNLYSMAKNKGGVGQSGNSGSPSTTVPDGAPTAGTHQVTYGKTTYTVDAKGQIVGTGATPQVPLQGVGGFAPGALPSAASPSPAGRPWFGAQPSGPGAVGSLTPQQVMYLDQNGYGHMVPLYQQQISAKAAAEVSAANLRNASSSLNDAQAKFDKAAGDLQTANRNLATVEQNADDVARTVRGTSNSLANNPNAANANEVIAADLNKASDANFKVSLAQEDLKKAKAAYGKASDELTEASNKYSDAQRADFTARSDEAIANDRVNMGNAAIEGNAQREEEFAAARFKADALKQKLTDDEAARLKTLKGAELGSAIWGGVTVAGSAAGILGIRDLFRKYSGSKLIQATAGTLAAVFGVYKLDKAFSLMRAASSADSFLFKSPLMKGLNHVLDFLKTPQGMAILAGAIVLVGWLLSRGFKPTDQEQPVIDAPPVYSTGPVMMVALGALMTGTGLQINPSSPPFQQILVSTSFVNSLMASGEAKDANGNPSSDPYAVTFVANGSGTSPTEIGNLVRDPQTGKTYMQVRKLANGLAWGSPKTPNYYIPWSVDCAENPNGGCANPSATDANQTQFSYITAAQALTGTPSAVAAHSAMAANKAGAQGNLK